MQRIESLTLRDPDIAIYLMVRQDPKRLTIYALAHSVHCAMVTLLMARRLGWGDAHTHTLLKAASTMNIAILDLQGRMAVVRDTARAEFAVTALAAEKNLVLRVPPERLFGLPE